MFGIEPLEPRLMLSTTPLISEFMASNDLTLADGDGNFSDWIEIYNPASLPIDLEGWHLTDDVGNLDKWTFPAVALDPGESMIIFASGQNVEDYVDSAGYLHTDFKLSSEGEFLAYLAENGFSNSPKVAASIQKALKEKQADAPKKPSVGPEKWKKLAAEVEILD